MKNFLAGWVVFQLLIMGIVFGSILYQLDRKTYDCSSHDQQLSWEVIPVAMMFPLALFISEDSIVEDIEEYCVGVEQVD